MIFGFAARQFRPYEQEVEVARMNGFGFLQIWYDTNGIFSKGVDEQVEIIKQCRYPAIIHAVLEYMFSATSFRICWVNCA